MIAYKVGHLGFIDSKQLSNSFQNFVSDKLSKIADEISSAISFQNFES